MAVGVGHLGGHKGMIKAYEDLGFEVTRVPSSGSTGIDVEALINKEIPWVKNTFCLLYTSPSPRDRTRSRMPSSA